MLPYKLWQQILYMYVNMHIFMEGAAFSSNWTVIGLCIMVKYFLAN